MLYCGRGREGLSVFFVGLPSPPLELKYSATQKIDEAKGVLGRGQKGGQQESQEHGLGWGQPR